MNKLFNSDTLTETQKNALFAFGDTSTIGTGCNLIIAASMCEGELTGSILTSIVDLIETSEITDGEFRQLMDQLRHETTERTIAMELQYQHMPGKLANHIYWRELVRMRILAAFGNEKCGITVTRLCYIEHVTVVPGLKQIIHGLIKEIAAMNAYHPETYQDMLKKARKVEEIWKIKVDELGYFTVKD